MRTATVADLVVVDDGAAVCKILEREEIVVRRTGAAVEDDERRRRAEVPGPQLAGDPVPRLGLLAVEPEGDRPVAHLHGPTLRSAG